MTSSGAPQHHGWYACRQREGDRDADMAELQDQRRPDQQGHERADDLRPSKRLQLPAGLQDGAPGARSHQARDGYPGNQGLDDGGIATERYSGAGGERQDKHKCQASPGEHPAEPTHGGNTPCPLLRRRRCDAADTGSAKAPAGEGGNVAVE